MKWQPFCEDCLQEGIRNDEDIEVDHVIPIDVRPDLRLEITNLRSRCRRHHRLKTNADQQQYGNRFGKYLKIIGQPALKTHR